MSEGVAVVAGFGRGISHAVAAKLGSKGFKLALISRTQSKLDAAAAAFEREGFTAKGYSADLSDESAVKDAIAKIRSDLGPVTIIVWNPAGTMTGLLQTNQEELQRNYNLAVSGLVAAVQASYEDLKSQAGKAAIMVTGGGMSVERDASVQAAINWNAFSTVAAKTAARKTVHIMNKQLGPEGIYAFELTVSGLVKGTDAADRLGAGAEPILTPELIADKYWEVYEARDLSVWYLLIAP